MSYNRNPQVQSIRGVGTPRLVLVTGKPFGFIVSSSVANPSLIQAETDHGLFIGQQIQISGHTGSTPDLNTEANELIAAADNKTFEATKGDWSDHGNHSAARDVTYKHAGAASLKITAAGVGDGAANYEELAAAKFPTIIAGNQYKLITWAYGDTNGVTLSLKIGDQIVAGQVVYNAAAGTFAKIVFQFLASSATVGVPWRVYASGAGNIWIDDNSLMIYSWGINTVPSKSSLTLPVNVTVAGTGGIFRAITWTYESMNVTTFDATHAYEAGSPALSMIQVGMRVSSYRTASAIDNPTYGKVVSVAAGSVEVDGWNNGTPTAGMKWIIDGWIVDLPRTGANGMTEIFDPDVFIHSLFGGDTGSRQKTKMRGWKYTCVLDYSDFLSPDVLLAMRHQLAEKANDSLVLIPRNDFPQFQVNVYYAAPVSLALFGKSPGYKKPIFTFKGKENLPGWQMIDGYGTQFATQYGICY